MKINKQLIWDYEFTEQEMKQDSFWVWYIARVLTRGGAADIRDIGLQNIHDFLPQTFLPQKIRSFWEWFFLLPESQARYGHFDASPKRLSA